MKEAWAVFPHRKQRLSSVDFQTFLLEKTSPPLSFCAAHLCSPLLLPFKLIHSAFSLSSSSSFSTIQITSFILHLLFVHLFFLTTVPKVSRDILQRLRLVLNLLPLTMNLHILQLIKKKTDFIDILLIFWFFFFWSCFVHLNAPLSSLLADFLIFSPFNRLLSLPYIVFPRSLLPPLFKIMWPNDLFEYSEYSLMCKCWLGSCCILISLKDEACQHPYEKLTATVFLFVLIF